MSRKFLIVGTFFGIQLRIDYSWFIVFALIAWAVMTSYLPSYHPGLSPVEITLAGLVITIVFFISVIAHEYAHSLVANKRGMHVRRITLFLFGGASELQHEPDSAKTELLMASAGPLMSLVLAGFFAVLWQAAQKAHLTAVEVLCQPLAVLNAGVGIFNLLPAFPLDGGRILRATIWYFRKNYMAAMRSATFVGIALSYAMMALGILELFGGYMISGLWFAIIGFFIMQSARFSYMQAMHEAILRGVKAQDVLSDKAFTIPSGTTLEQFMAEYVLRYKQYGFIVIDHSGKPIGIIEMPITTQPRQEETVRPVDDFMVPLTKGLFVRPTDAATRVLRTMQLHNIDILPVVEGTKILGVVMRRYLDDYVMVHRLQAG